MTDDKPINEVVVILVSNKYIDNGDVIPITEIFRYDIYDDGKDIINYIENRVLTGIDSCGRLSPDNKYNWDRFKPDKLNVGDEVRVDRADHPLNGCFGEIKQFSVNSDVCLVLINCYLFHIKKSFLVKNRV